MDWTVKDETRFLNFPYPMARTPRITCVIFFLILTWSSMYSQSKDELRYDIELWSEISVSKKISKKLDFDLGFNFRYQDSIRQFKSKFYQSSVKYDLFSFIG